MIFIGQFKYINYICQEFTYNPETMFDFQQYLGFLAFMTILTIGFWLMIFLVSFIVPYWIYGGVKEFLQEKKAKRELEQA